MDRISQLQRLFDKLSSLHFTSLGVIQRDAPPLLDGGVDWSSATPANMLATSSASPAELAANREAWIRFNAQSRDLAHEIVLLHTVIAELLDSLPPKEHDHASQMRLIAELNDENQRTTAELNAKIQEAEKLLTELRSTLQFIGEERFSANS